MPTFESDICILGGGISAALLAQRVTQLRPGTSIIAREIAEAPASRPRRGLERLELLGILRSRRWR